MKLGSLLVSGGKFRFPCVYEFIKNGVVTYVGRSSRGFCRAFRGAQSGGRRENRRTDAFNVADQIRVTVFDNTDEAKTEEIRLIKLHKPCANRHHVLD